MFINISTVCSSGGDGSAGDGGHVYIYLQSKRAFGCTCYADTAAAAVSRVLTLIYLQNTISTIDKTRFQAQGFVSKQQPRPLALKTRRKSVIRRLLRRKFKKQHYIYTSHHNTTAGVRTSARYYC